MLKTKRILFFLLLLMIIAGTMTGCNVKKTKSFQCVEDFEQARIGILTGSSHDNTAKELFPNASRVYFNNMSDMILAVEQGKICALQYHFIWGEITLLGIGKIDSNYIFQRK